MPKRPAVTEAMLKRARKALGAEFGGFVFRPDGSVTVLTADQVKAQQSGAPASNDLDAELEAWDAKHGYG